MNKSTYLLGTLVSVALIYSYYSPTITKKDNPILFEAKTNQQYASINQEYRGNFVGTYKTTNSKKSKELILDSTYTYSCIISFSTQEILLEGTWELSYKDSSQHIVLSPPTIKSNSQKLDKTEKAIISIKEQKLKVTKNGNLIDLTKKETFIKQRIENQALVIQQ